MCSADIFSSLKRKITDCLENNILKKNSIFPSSSINNNNSDLFTDNFRKIVVKISLFLLEPLKTKNLNILNLKHIKSMSHIDYDIEKQTISYFTKNKINPYKKDFFSTTYQEDNIEKRKRTISLYKFYNRIGGFLPQEIERIVESYRLLEPYKNESNIILLEGEQIQIAYNSEYYYKDNKSSLYNSCMKDKLDFLNLYIENPESVKVVALTNSYKLGETEFKIKARALVWFTEQKKVLVDKIYYNSNEDLLKIKKYSLNKGWYIKNYNNNINNFIFINKKGETVDVHDVSIKLKKIKFEKYPFLDTFYFLNKEKILSANESIFRLRNSNGFLSKKCDVCDEGYIYCKINELKSDKQHIFDPENKIYIIEGEYFYKNHSFVVYYNISLIRKKIEKYKKYFDLKEDLFNKIIRGEIEKGSSLEVSVSEILGLDLKLKEYSYKSLFLIEREILNNFFLFLGIQKILQMLRFSSEFIGIERIEYLFNFKLNFILKNIYFFNKSDIKKNDSDSSLIEQEQYLNSTGFSRICCPNCAGEIYYICDSDCFE